MKRTNIKNKLETNSNTKHSNYCTKITSQVDALENISQHIKIIEKEKGKNCEMEITITRESQKEH